MKPSLCTLHYLKLVDGFLYIISTFQLNYVVLFQRMCVGC